MPKALEGLVSFQATRVAGCVLERPYGASRGLPEGVCGVGGVLGYMGVAG
jgi:hypothetical protein